jgi:hypothetical protein
MRTAERHCRNCHSLLSVNGEFTTSSPCFGMTSEQIDEYFATGVDPREKLDTPAEPPSLNITEKQVDEYQLNQLRAIHANILKQAEYLLERVEFQEKCFNLKYNIHGVTNEG